MGSFDFIKNGKHQFHDLQERDVPDAEKRLGFSFPDELKMFYSEVGYGVLKGADTGKFNRLLDPDTIADITLREGLYECDPDLELYEEADKLIFFELVEGVYLTLDLNSQHQSPVYFFDAKIADSLVDFMQKMDQNTDYYDVAVNKMFISIVKS